MSTLIVSNSSINRKRRWSVSSSHEIDNVANNRTIHYCLLDANVMSMGTDGLGLILMNGEIMKVHSAGVTSDVILYSSMISNDDYGQVEGLKKLRKSRNSANSNNSSQGFSIAANVVGLRDIVCAKTTHEATSTQSYCSVIHKLEGGKGTVLMTLSIVSEDNSNCETSKYELDLLQEDEYITAVDFVDTADVILGSNRGNLYMVDTKTPGSHFSIRAFNKSKSSWMLNLANTSLGLLGLNGVFTSTNPRQPQNPVVSLFRVPIDLSSNVIDIRFIAVLNSSIEIWKYSIRSHSSTQLLEISILESLFQQLLTLGAHQSSVSLHALKIVNSLLLSFDPIQKVATLIVLSTNTDKDNLSGSLWLHLLELNLQSLHLNISATVLVHPSIAVNVDQRFNPRVHATAPLHVSSHRIYLSWIASSSELCAAMVDVMNIKVFSQQQQTTEVKSIPQLLDENTRVRIEDLVDVGVVNGIDALSVLTKDGNVYLVSPIIQGHPFDISYRISFSVKTPQDVENPKILLLDIIAGKTDISQLSAAAKMCLKSLPDDDMESLLLDLGREIAEDSRRHSEDISLSDQETDEVFVLLLLNQKVDRFQRLCDCVNTLKLMSGFSSSSIFTSFQSTLLMRSLWITLQDAQDQIIEAKQLPDELPWSFMDQSLQVSLNYLTLVLSHIGNGISDSKTEIEKIEVVFHNSNNFLSLLEVLQTSIREYMISSRESVKHQFHLVYGLISIISVTFTSADVQEVCADSFGSILMNELVRDLLCCLAENFWKLIDFLEEGNEEIEIAASNLQLNEHQYNVVVRTLNEFTRLILKGFELEALLVSSCSKHEQISSSFGKFGQHLSTKWKMKYEKIKSVCVTTLIRLGYIEAAFLVSKDFMCHRGIMESFASDPQRYSSSLIDILQRFGDVQGTKDETFAYFCLDWLESKEFPVKLIFDLGKHCPREFESFLKLRPHLSFLHQIQNKQYGEAALASLAVGSEIEGVVEAQTMISIAKLTALLAREDDGATKTNNNLVLKDKNKNLSGQSNAIIFEADKRLALLSYQNLICSSFPRRFESFVKNTKIDALELLHILCEELEFDSIECLSTKSITELIVIGFNIFAIVAMQNSKLDFYDSVHQELLVRLWKVSFSIQNDFWNELNTNSLSLISTKQQIAIQDSIFGSVHRILRSQFFDSRICESPLIEKAVGSCFDGANQNIQHIVRNILVDAN